MFGLIVSVVCYLIALGVNDGEANEELRTILVVLAWWYGVTSFFYLSVPNRAKNQRVAERFIQMMRTVPQNMPLEVCVGASWLSYLVTRALLALGFYFCFESIETHALWASNQFVAGVVLIGIGAILSTPLTMLLAAAGVEARAQTERASRMRSW